MEDYPSDITSAQFDQIRDILDIKKKKTKPRTVDLHEVFCAVSYSLKTGCQWRYLPKKYPKWQTVYSYFQKWCKKKADEESLLERALKKIVGKIRKEDNREEKTTFIIVDAQSVKNTDTAEEKGYDGGKKVSGIKRHIAVDTHGLPHAIAITTANVTDRAGAITMITESKENLEKVKNVMVDGGYTGKPFADAMKEILGAGVEVAKRNEIHKFKVIPKRWVVERCFGWLEKFRRLWKNCERKLNTSLQMVNLAFILILLRRL